LLEHYTSKVSGGTHLFTVLYGGEWSDWSFGRFNTGGRNSSACWVSNCWQNFVILRGIFIQSPEIKWLSFPCSWL